ncbi:hypothetical protein TB1_042575 [Malus domestica]
MSFYNTDIELELLLLAFQGPPPNLFFRLSANCSFVLLTVAVWLHTSICLRASSEVSGQIPMIRRPQCGVFLEWRLNPAQMETMSWKLGRRVGCNAPLERRRRGSSGWRRMYLGVRSS